ncbi:MAG: zf-HC2 domain-containing protein [Oscillospiraceae bacterium]|nr:zf-HC2 domain-containing protein [Oscillospiraceae bacterium]
MNNNQDNMDNMQNDMGNAGCAAWQDQINDYLDGGLGREELSLFIEHMNACAECANAVRLSRALRDAGRALGGEDVIVPDGFSASVMAAVRAEGALGPAALAHAGPARGMGGATGRAARFQRQQPWHMPRQLRVAAMLLICISVGLAASIIIQVYNNHLMSREAELAPSIAAAPEPSGAGSSIGGANDAVTEADGVNGAYTEADGANGEAEEEAGTSGAGAVNAAAEGTETEATDAAPEATEIASGTTGAAATEAEAASTGIGRALGAGDLFNASEDEGDERVDAVDAETAPGAGAESELPTVGAAAAAPDADAGSRAGERVPTTTESVTIVTAKEASDITTSSAEPARAPAPSASDTAAPIPGGTLGGAEGTTQAAAGETGGALASTEPQPGDRPSDNDEAPSRGGMMAPQPEDKGDSADTVGDVQAPAPPMIYPPIDDAPTSLEDKGDAMSSTRVTYEFVFYDIRDNVDLNAGRVRRLARVYAAGYTTIAAGNAEGADRAIWEIKIDGADLGRIEHELSAMFGAGGDNAAAPTARSGSTATVTVTMMFTD